MNDYGNTPPATGNNDPMDEDYVAPEGGESVPCLHIYAMPDGSFVTEESEGPAPDGEPMDATGVQQLVQAFVEPQEDPEALAAAQKGYGKPREMQAPNPGGLFGE